MLPGAYFHKENQKRDTSALKKAGQGVWGAETNYLQARKKEHASGGRLEKGCGLKVPLP